MPRSKKSKVRKLKNVPNKTGKGDKILLGLLIFVGSIILISKLTTTTNNFTGLAVKQAPLTEEFDVNVPDVLRTTLLSIPPSLPATWTVVTSS
jgi:hypothetical protein